MRTQLIVLRATKFQESDLILQGLTAEAGKLSLIARGALRSRKRFGGGILEPTHHVEVQYLKSRSEGMATLQEAKLLNPFSGLRESFEKLEMALKIVQAVSRVSQEGDVHVQSLYYLTGHALKGLESCANIPQFKVHFAIRFLLQQGVLEQESWMGPYLHTAMADSALLQTETLEKTNQLRIETALQEYLGPFGNS